MSAVRTACVAALALSSCLWGAEKPKDVDPIWKRFDKGPRGFEIAILASKTTVKVNEPVRLSLLVRNAGPEAWGAAPLVYYASTALFDGVHLIPASAAALGDGCCIVSLRQRGTVHMHSITHRWNKAGVYRVQILYGDSVPEIFAFARHRGEKITEVPPDRLSRPPVAVSTHPIEITVTE